MLQDFRRRTTPDTGAARLAALRSAMAAAGVDAFLVPRADAHQGENVAARDERLAWLTGFTGSAGTAAVTADKAAIFVDGRYRLQVQGQVDTGRFEVRRIPQDRTADWLAEALPRGGRVGFDPWLHTAREVEELAEALGPRQVGLTRVANLVDAAWSDQPAPPARPIVPHPVALAGRTSADKRSEIAADLVARDLAAAVLTLPDSIAWLLNVRGSDIARTPVPLAFAILHGDGRVDLFTDPEKVRRGGARPPRPRGRRVAAGGLRAGARRADRAGGGGQGQRACLGLRPDRRGGPRRGGVGARSLHPAEGDQDLGRDRRRPRRAPARRRRDGGVPRLAGSHRARGRADRDRRGAAAGGDPRRDRQAARHLVRDDLRRRRRTARSCTTASPRPRTARSPRANSCWWTAARNTPTAPPTSPAPSRWVRSPHAAIRPFTLVLKGLIAMCRLLWPEGLAGRDIDAVARAALWRAGMDYDHGTGHGIGSYLGVHEGPQSLSRRGLEPLLPGMILSIEPGYYREGAFGIRTREPRRGPPAAAGGRRRPRHARLRGADAGARSTGG